MMGILTSQLVSAYKAALSINSCKGVVRCALILFDELAKADEGGILAGRREVLVSCRSRSSCLEFP